MQGSGFRIGCWVVILWSAIDARARAGYEVIDLGTLPGGSQSIGVSLSPTGRVAGSATTDLGFTHAFRTGSSGALVDLMTLPGGRNSDATGINALGQVVGRSEVRVGGFLTTHAFMAVPSGSGQPTLIDLGTLPGGFWSEATAINATGVVAGFGDVGGGRTHAFVSVGGAMQDLGTLVGGSSSRAGSINEAGSITGWSDTSSGETHAIRSGASGNLIDLGTLPGASFSFGQGINASNQVVGYSGGSSFGASRAFLAEADGMMVSLGVLAGGVSSFALGINDEGSVVGQSLLPNARSRAVLWGPDRLPIDLNSLIKPGTGWELSAALAINANGQITGYGLVDVATPSGVQRQTHAFLLNPISPINPVPEPSAAALLALGGLALGTLARLGLGRAIGPRAEDADGP